MRWTGGLAFPTSTAWAARRRQALKSPHIVGFFFPYGRSLLILVWSAQAEQGMFSGCNTWPDCHSWPSRSIAIPEWASQFKQHRDHEMDPQTDRAMQELAQLNMLYLSGVDMLYLTGGGDSMCYVYHEKLRRFLPWPPNSILKLYTGVEFFV